MARETNEELMGRQLLGLRGLFCMASSLESGTDTHSGRVARIVPAVIAYQGLLSQEDRHEWKCRRTLSYVRYIRKCGTYTSGLQRNRLITVSGEAQ